MKNDRNQPPVGFNESSGAEKVERIEQEAQMQREKERKEFAAAQNRVEAAQEKKRAKELKMQEKRLAETERQRIRAEKQTKAA
ncbi:MAG: hypothetical protein IJX98_01790 [Clostridia bacterium]|nr:hypothetical protein [Clostridia bacterium]